MKKIFVSGANGHLGWNITEELIKRGYKVKGSVTNINDASRVDRLTKAGVEVVEAHLEDRRSLEKAVQGCDAIMHVAAPFKMASGNPEKDIYEAAIAGTVNIMEAVKTAGIGKIVYTSSSGALGSSGKNDPLKTENDYVKNPRLHYIRAKADSENKFWEYAEKYKLNGVATLPSTMLGPGFVRPTPSVQVFVDLYHGKLPALPPFHFDYVDVRDVAKAHVDILENNKAKGRYILNGKGYYVKEIAEMLRRDFPELKVPNLFLPEWMVPVAVAFDWIETKLTGKERLVTSDVIDEFGPGKLQKYSSQKARDELGWNPRPVEESLRDMIAWIKTNFPKKKP